MGEKNNFFIERPAISGSELKPQLKNQGCDTALPGQGQCTSWWGEGG
jgi:hypothetical protein